MQTALGRTPVPTAASLTADTAVLALMAASLTVEGIPGSSLMAGIMAVDILRNPTAPRRPRRRAAELAVL